MSESYLHQLEEITRECVRLRQELHEEQRKTESMAEKIETLQQQVKHLSSMTGWRNGM
jgi:uncharacterized protein YlxW (UPF0749 family)